MNNRYLDSHDSIRGNRSIYHLDAMSWEDEVPGGQGLPNIESYKTWRTAPFWFSSFSVCHSQVVTSLPSFSLHSFLFLFLIIFKYALFASVDIASAFAAAVPTVDLKSVLQQTKNKWGPHTQIFFPSDPNYTNETTQRWNFYSAPSYLASIKPGSEADVQKVVSRPSSQRRVLTLPDSLPFADHICLRIGQTCYSI